MLVASGGVLIFRKDFIAIYLIYIVNNSKHNKNFIFTSIIKQKRTTKEYQKEALDALTFVLKNAIPYEHVDFWLSQMFIIKKQSANSLFKS
jgi:hypothetical protein